MMACIGHEADGPFEKRINNNERFSSHKYLTIVLLLYKFNS